MSYGDSFSLPSLVNLYSGGIPLFSLTHIWQVKVMSGSTGLCRTPQYYAIQSMSSLLMCLRSKMGSVCLRCDTFNEG